MKFIFDPEIVSAYLYTCSCLEKCHSFGPSFPSYGNENRSFPLDVPAILIKKNPRRSALSLNTLRGTRNQTVSFTRAISKKRKRFLLVKMLLFTICTSNMSSMRNTEKKIIFLPWTVRKQIFVMYHSHVKIAVSWYFDWRLNLFPLEDALPFWRLENKLYLVDFISFIVTKRVWCYVKSSLFYWWYV